jgi:thioredoxin reductase
MIHNDSFDVIIVGGSYSGLAAAMALGRALRKVLIIDNGKPCNRQTPHSHNFLTQDGRPPKEIAAIGREQVVKYDTVKFLDGVATAGIKTQNGFEVQTDGAEIFKCRKIIFATGIRDIMPDIPGFAECWGISVLHCPYCHGYEVKNVRTGILGNGEYGFEFSALISNWTKDIILFTNGKPALSYEQVSTLRKHNISIVEAEIEKLEHSSGNLESILFKDGLRFPITAIYARCAFEQHSKIPETLGCKLTDEGYIEVGALQNTSIEGVFASGDNSSRMRTVANAVSTGTTAGAMLNKEMIIEDFK